MMWGMTSEIQHLDDVCTLGPEEIIFLLPKNLEEWKKPVDVHGINSKTLMMKKSSVPGILTVARSEAVSMISTSLSKDKVRWISRSVIKGLLKSSPVPVILFPNGVPKSEAKQERMFDHVVFATDWSASCEKAIQYLLGFKEIIKELEIVHVIEKKLSVKEMRDLKEKLAQTRKKFLEQGIDAESHVYAGTPSEEILLAFKDYDATCIVMGTTRKSRMKALFSRSNTYRVAEASIVPMLVIP
jgi:nucleotide-binding universal stress UspA family protein